MRIRHLSPIIILFILLILVGCSSQTISNDINKSNSKLTYSDNITVYALENGKFKCEDGKIVDSPTQCVTIDYPDFPELTESKEIEESTSEKEDEG